MSETNLNVSRQTIKEFFGSLKDGKKIIIPDYQRRYEWDKEKCETLWEDIESFSNGNESENTEYFLGTVVSCLNENNLEIIDGQQRVTSLMLLLRAFYTHLEEMDCKTNEEKEKVNGLKLQIEQCLWEVDEYSGRANDREKIKVLSDVATDNEKDIFYSIMKTGKITDGKDNYTQNYNYFLSSCHDYARKNPLSWLRLCLTILNKCIILPINCNSQDTALTIFSTLNDRGLPLSDSDIFKAKMYKSSENRDEFIQKWKDFSEICELSGLSINDIFRYYSHVIRARNENTEKEIALRRFYLKDNLKDVDLDSLIKLAKFWFEIRNQNSTLAQEDDGYISIECRKYIQCLNHYPNDYWKYVISVFFFSEHKDFNEEFCTLLKKLVAFLFAKFIESPTVNAIKTDVFKFCVFVYWKGEKGSMLELSNKDEVFKNIRLFNNSKLTKSLILLHSYLDSGDEQKELISSTFDIEH